MAHPVLTTERLRLEPVTMADRDFVFALFSNPEVKRYLFDEEPLVDRRDAETLINKYWVGDHEDRCRWKIVGKTSGVPMGTCGFHGLDPATRNAEVGYDLLPEYWGNGYALEAMRSLIEHMRRSGCVDTLTAVVYSDNARSAALALSLGFSKTGGTEQTVYRGREYPHHRYVLALAGG